MTPRKAALALALPTLTLLVGVGIGILWNRPPTLKIALPSIPETVQDPPFTTQIAGRELLKDICYRSAAYASLVTVDRRSIKDLAVAQFAAMPYSDRGVLCRIEGKIYITTYGPGSQTITKRSEPVQVNILASITGESEIVSDEFVKLLVGSTTVKAMSSNVGNDGTVRPKDRL
jgi:hypothetical protein